MCVFSACATKLNVKKRWTMTTTTTTKPNSRKWTNAQHFMCSQFAEQPCGFFFAIITLFCVIIWFLFLLLESNVAKSPNLISFVYHFNHFRGKIEGEREKENERRTRVKSKALHTPRHTHTDTHSGISGHRHGEWKSLRIFHKNYNAWNGRGRWLWTTWNKHIRCPSFEYKLSSRRQCKYRACVATPMSGATFAKVKKVILYMRSIGFVVSIDTVYIGIKCTTICQCLPGDFIRCVCVAQNNFHRHGDNLL